MRAASRAAAAPRRAHQHDDVRVHGRGELRDVGHAAPAERQVGGERQRARRARPQARLHGAQQRADPHAQQQPLAHERLVRGHGDRHERRVRGRNQAAAASAGQRVVRRSAGGRGTV
jgi:hypothetical protein